MKPVMQDKFGEEGNCGQARIASILELPLEEVIDFRAAIDEGKAWYFVLRDFLLAHGYLPMTYYQQSASWPKIKPKGYHIAGGPSSRNPDGHYVVCLDGEMVHDPHPDGTGIPEVTDWILLIPIVGIEP